MDTLIRSHWEMVECLFDEIYLGKHDDTLHSHEMLEELFRYFASHDPRFHEAGLMWNLRGYIEYIDGSGNRFLAEAAIAAFLGLELKTSRGVPAANHAALRMIYRPFKDLLDGREWVRWHVQKMHGYSCKQRELWRGYPRDFPRISNQNKQLEIK